MKLFIREKEVPCVIVKEPLDLRPYKRIDSVAGPASFVSDTCQCMKVVIKFIKKVHAEEITVRRVPTYLLSMWNVPWSIKVIDVIHDPVIE